MPSPIIIFEKDEEVKDLLEGEGFDNIISFNDSKDLTSFTYKLDVKPLVIINFSEGFEDSCLDLVMVIDYMFSDIIVIGLNINNKLPLMELHTGCSSLIEKDYTKEDLVQRVTFWLKYLREKNKLCDMIN